MLQDLPQCGSNLAATDAVLAMQALVATEPSPDAVTTAASKAAAAAVVARFLEAKGLPALIQVWVCPGPPAHHLLQLPARLHT